MRLLLVEDDTKLVRALTLGLEREGYVVDAAESGDLAMELARATDYEGIVLDLMLPGIDGFTVCRQLRSEGRWMPVLMLTARTDVTDRIRGLDAGADDYLVKPFDFGELLARLRALLRRGPIERPPTMAIGDLRIDAGTRVVTRAGEEIELTAREYDVLEFLARRPGRVVSRSELLDEIWSDYEGSPNIIDVYVGYLRKKLGARSSARSAARDSCWSPGETPDPRPADGLVHRGADGHHRGARPVRRPAVPRRHARHDRPRRAPHVAAARPPVRGRRAAGLRLVQRHGPAARRCDQVFDSGGRLLAYVG